MEAALENVRAVARSGKKEAMYAIYTTDAQGRVAGVMSLRELLAAPPGAKIGDIAWTEVVSVSPSADREEVARVIANYDMVAVPVVSESGHVMGVITVDDVIDAIQEEQTEDVQKFGGMEALDEPYIQISFWRDDQEARGLAQRALPRRDAHGHGARRLSERDRSTDAARAVPAADHQLGRQLGIAGDVADHSRDRAARGEPARLVARRRPRARHGRDARRRSSA